ncbi:MAG: hypothetical protein D6800_06845 [Candidatus Zixiibacteriota bacterium]|nr:MAG: hypothetical protein D6800_06845 [candidate division Zixibacteria bacterium]
MGEELKLKRIASHYQFEIEQRPTPSDEDVAAIVTERLVALLEADLRSRDNVQRERLGRFIALARSLGEAEDESAVVAMLLDDYYQKSLHAPPEQPFEEEAASRPKAKKPRAARARRSSHGGRRRDSRRRR